MQRKHYTKPTHHPNITQRWNQQRWIKMWTRISRHCDHSANFSQHLIHLYADDVFIYTIIQRCADPSPLFLLYHVHFTRENYNTKTDSETPLSIISSNCYLQTTILFVIIDEDDGQMNGWVQFLPRSLAEAAPRCETSIWLPAQSAACEQVRRWRWSQRSQCHQNTLRHSPRPESAPAWIYV